MRVLAFFLLGAALSSAPSPGQILQLSREEMIRYTAKNPFDRFPDGRPRVPDSVLERVKELSVEDAWGLLRNRGYHNQYAGDFQILHPGRKLVGRAVTAQYLPLRPDVAEVLAADAKAKGLPTGNSQRVADVLQLNDVPVVDLMGGEEGHNFGGDNIHAAVYGVTRTGAVVDGTIRDLEGIFELPTQIYFRKPHPAAVSRVSVAGINIPIRIGSAIVMPGDVVFGDRTGVIFIPPHLVEEIVTNAEAVRIKDEWTKNKFLTGKYKASELYGGPLSPELKKEFDEYLKKRLAEMNKRR
jgi:4-hydroxy-4-methyl-2-oxoglutarate aldolase